MFMKHFGVRIIVFLSLIVGVAGCDSSGKTGTPPAAGMAPTTEKPPANSARPQ